MALHHLYGQQQLEDCLALVGTDDTLLIMDASVLEAAGDALSTLPCAVMILDDAGRHGANHASLPVIDTTRWLELIIQHPHSMSWA